MTHEGMAASVLALQCTESTIPDQLQAAREKRRERMDPRLRVRWLQASNEVALPEESVNHVVDTLTQVRHRATGGSAFSRCAWLIASLTCWQLELELHHDLRARFRVVRDVLRDVSTVSAQTREALERELDDSSSLQSILHAASARYRSSVADNEVRIRPCCLLL